MDNYDTPTNPYTSTRCSNVEGRKLPHSSVVKSRSLVFFSLSPCMDEHRKVIGKVRGLMGDADDLTSDSHPSD